MTDPRAGSPRASGRRDRGGGDLPPGPRAPLLGLWSLVAFRRDMLGFLVRLQARYGDVARFRMGHYRITLISDPDLIERVFVTDARSFTKGRALKMSRAVLGDGLLTSEGETHLRQRRMIQPVFHRARLETYAAAMTDCATRAADAWSDGMVVDMALEMRRLALAIVSRTLFGTDETDAESEELIEALTTLMSMFRRVAMPFAQLIGRLPLPSNRRFEEAKARVDETMHRLIAQHRADSAAHSDLLARLIEARDEEGDHRGMSDEQIRDEVLTLFAAGHETTALALTWTWHLLGQHPDVAATLHAELDAVLAGRPATYADLERLPFTRRVLTESMRLLPPAYAVGRTAEVDYRAGAWTIPAATTVLISQYVVHRDPRWFPEPERFDPDRWTDEFRAALPRFAYFPFGGGPRICIGEGFAWAEAMIVLATLAQRFTARHVPGHPVVPEAIMTLRPRHGLRMTLQRRG